MVRITAKALRAQSDAEKKMKMRLRVVLHLAVYLFEESEYVLTKLLSMIFVNYI